MKVFESIKMNVIFAMQAEVNDNHITQLKAVRAGKPEQISLDWSACNTYGPFFNLIKLASR